MNSWVPEAARSNHGLSKLIKISSARQDNECEIPREEIMRKDF